MTSYFVLYNSEDGLRIVEYNTKTLKALLEDTTVTHQLVPIGSIPHCQEEWNEHEILVIKGDIIVPTRIQVVTKYEIE